MSSARQPQTPRFWLTPTRGPALAVPPRGLLFGRGAACDVVLEDRQASARHALLRPSADGLELFALGRNPTRVNGEAADRCRLLQPRDRLEMPGGSWRVSAEAPSPMTALWQVRFEGASVHGLRWFPLTVGGGPDDHLRVAGWPPETLTFSVLDGRLVIEVGAEVTLEDEVLPAGAVEVPRHGDVLERGGIALVMVAAEQEVGATVMADDARLPVEARFTFLPSGGRLTLRFSDGRERSLELPELRARLVAGLLQAAPPGSWVADDVLITAVWSARSGRGRTDLNLLIHHTRKALLKAGLDPSLLDRARRGGAARFALAAGGRAAIT